MTNQTQKALEEFSESLTSCIRDPLAMAARTPDLLSLLWQITGELDLEKLNRIQKKIGRGKSRFSADDLESIDAAITVANTLVSLRFGFGAVGELWGTLGTIFEELKAE